jgi:hypothetical protein
MSNLEAGKVLLLHPDDGVPPQNKPAWHLIVDLGRAPASTYDEWSQQSGCRVMSLFERTEGVRDLYRTRELLEYGMGEAVDRFGIDWWDVLAQSIVPQIQQLMFVRRLAETLEAGTHIYSTRPHFLARALQGLVGGRLVILQNGRQRIFGGVNHYVTALRQLDFAQFTQVLQDKFDPQHIVRRRFARPPKRSARPLVLLPSGYINVSRTAVAYAAMLPDIEFLLLTARNNGRLEAVPKNVRAASLDGYFSNVVQSEAGSLWQACRRLHLKIAASAPEFEIAEASGLLASLEGRLLWGLAARNAWNAVFDSETITACLCADDSNPYSRLPLIIAKGRGIPALACHHGALDSRMAIKKRHADFYLAKSEMEQDYLVRVCRIASDHIVTGTPTFHRESQEPPSLQPPSPGWLVFFTEPYHASGWRTGDVYRELLPKLLAVARECGLELVFKLHPFESAVGHRRMLRRYLDAQTTAAIRIIVGPSPPQLWQLTKCALTVQSTVALECSRRGIPVFLCGWLADACAGYVQQFERFGFGRVLRTPSEFEQVPGWIASPAETRLCKRNAEPLDPKILRQLLQAAYSRAELASA